MYRLLLLHFQDQQQTQQHLLSLVGALPLVWHQVSPSIRPDLRAFCFAFLTESSLNV